MSSKVMLESCMKISCTGKNSEEVGSTILYYLKDGDVNNLVDIKVYIKKEGDKTNYLIKGNYLPINLILMILKAEGVENFHSRTVYFKTFESTVVDYEEVLY